MATTPHRYWTGRELAGQLNIPPKMMLIQLAIWTSQGHFIRTSRATYALNTPASTTSSPSAPDP
jgi:hypothetical protein